MTLAVLPPSPRQGTAITYATRSTVPTTPTRTTTDSPGEVERDARNAYVVYFEARAIRAGVIFSSAMHGRWYSRREQSANRLPGGARVARKKNIWHTGQRFSTLVVHTRLSAQEESWKPGESNNPNAIYSMKRYDALYKKVFKELNLSKKNNISLILIYLKSRL